MSGNTCPICGEPLDGVNADFLDNGSPAHPKCMALEEQRKKEKEEILK